jgi:hypothetical protein
MKFISDGIFPNACTLTPSYCNIGGVEIELDAEMDDLDSAFMDLYDMILNTLKGVMHDK